MSERRQGCGLLSQFGPEILCPPAYSAECQTIGLRQMLPAGLVLLTGVSCYLGREAHGGGDTVTAIWFANSSRSMSHPRSKPSMRASQEDGWSTTPDARGQGPEFSWPGTF
ncbi:uncharacterized protein HMPREF1120_00127 [Exophiala dermatitidis NIH/UT8656]|uniref:Uncharacterized protein n=1 Tax=Exophiala dermatitidis (strain ATCC 34100 / CBS 525.76 / NIH/UT8656) TaxID=858893 RepID=H6BLL2_EXODN|nr:uncharacterized protein HMPREF1120_00127 [Exophiala dermatitidis NIH/UT8656]EHY51904.1 hypothetical protein HMPREF1120_00127 [Exophiala dermatitidis NIH/UT8656]